MASKSKAKGNRNEREVVKIFEEYGYSARRAWGSVGRSLGLNEEVDVLVNIKSKDFAIQVKGRKRIADYLKPDTDKVSMQILHEDRGKYYIVMDVYDYLNEIYRHTG